MTPPSFIVGFIKGFTRSLCLPEDWQAFNNTYLVVYPEAPGAVLEILGLQAFDNVNVSFATAKSREETAC
jgi:hypothetical protein